MKKKKQMDCIIKFNYQETKQNTTRYYAKGNNTMLLMLCQCYCFKILWFLGHSNTGYSKIIKKKTCKKHYNVLRCKFILFI